MSSTPEVSVLLPVRNAQPHLREALDSLAGQTRRDFEVVAVDDGSTDDSRDLLRAFAATHDWLRVVVQEPGGVARALNRALAESRGALIARMDADDRAMPERLGVQADFLRREPAVGVCGSWIRVFGGKPDGVVRVPVTDAEIRARLVFGSAFAHPAVMMRRELIASPPGPYDAAEDGAEDYGLWLRLARRTRFHNLPRVLLHYRKHVRQVTRRPAEVRIAQLQAGFLAQQGMSPSAADLRAHAAAGFDEIGEPWPSMAEVQAWLTRLGQALPATGWCDAALLRRECAEAWWRFVRRQGRGGGVALAFWRSGLISRDGRSAWRALRLALER
jgi:glycosyltransferase involved in cell wall biosynthesis